MKKIVCLLLALLAVCSVSAAFAQEILYTGTVTKAMTIREKKSTSARKLGSVEANELISVIAYENEWTTVEKDGVTGYVLSKNVVDLALAQGYRCRSDAVYRRCG